MTPQEWTLAVFLFAFGCCIGSFLNVVIYRLPREKSLIRPGSACPGCGQAIRFFDNIPLVSWVVLGAKCRYCKAPISARYFIVELLTGSVFLGLYVVYFHTSVRTSMQVPGGWFVYLLHLVLLGAFIAGSGIDLELWIIPLSICWLVTAVGIIGSAVGPHVIEPRILADYVLLPVASARTGAMALGAAVGLGLSLMLLKVRLLPRSYELSVSQEYNGPVPQEDAQKTDSGDDGPSEEPEYAHRLEALKEIAFLLPIILGAVVASAILTRPGAIGQWWNHLLEGPIVAGLLGSVFGYFIGCAVVWATRILGTLGFGKEAMGLGDVHLMGAAGAVVGPVMVAIAFFLAPFFGLGWALFQMFFKKIRQIPYGPFLSLAVFTVMILHDWILHRLAVVFYR